MCTFILDLEVALNYCVLYMYKTLFYTCIKHSIFRKKLKSFFKAPSGSENRGGQERREGAEAGKE